MNYFLMFVFFRCKEASQWDAGAVLRYPRHIRTVVFPYTTWQWKRSGIYGDLHSTVDCGSPEDSVCLKHNIHGNLLTRCPPPSFPTPKSSEGPDVDRRIPGSKDECLERMWYRSIWSRIICEWQMYRCLQDAHWNKRGLMVFRTWSFRTMDIPELAWCAGLGMCTFLFFSFTYELKRRAVLRLEFFFSAVVPGDSKETGRGSMKFKFLHWLMGFPLALTWGWDLSDWPLFDDQNQPNTCCSHLLQAAGPVHASIRNVNLNVYLYVSSYHLATDRVAFCKNMDSGGKRSRRSKELEVVNTFIVFIA